MNTIRKKLKKKLFLFLQLEPELFTSISASISLEFDANMLFVGFAPFSFAFHWPLLPLLIPNQCLKWLSSFRIWYKHLTILPAQVQHCRPQHSPSAVIAEPETHKHRSGLPIVNYSLRPKICHIWLKEKSKIRNLFLRFSFMSQFF